MATVPKIAAGKSHRLISKCDGLKRDELLFFMFLQAFLMQLKSNSLILYSHMLALQLQMLERLFNHFKSIA